MEKTKKIKTGIMIFIIVAIVAVTAVLVNVIWYRNYTKEIHAGEAVENMGQREGVCFENVLIEMEYLIKVEGGTKYNRLFVFNNGDVYSGSDISANGREAGRREQYFYEEDDGYWDDLRETYYWGRISEQELDMIFQECSLMEPNRKGSWYQKEFREEPSNQSIGETTGREHDSQDAEEESGEESEVRVGNLDYGGHRYRIRMRMIWGGDERNDLEDVSYGDRREMYRFFYDEHAHNIIDLVKSTWFYEQWMNRIFGEEWEERIYLKDYVRRWPDL